VYEKWRERETEWRSRREPEISTISRVKYAFTARSAITHMKYVKIWHVKWYSAFQHIVLYRQNGICRYIAHNVCECVLCHTTCVHDSLFSKVHNVNYLAYSHKQAFARLLPFAVTIHPFFSNMSTAYRPKIKKIFIYFYILELAIVVDVAYANTSWLSLSLSLHDVYLPFHRLFSHSHTFSLFLARSHEHLSLSPSSRFGDMTRNVRSKKYIQRWNDKGIKRDNKVLFFSHEFFVSGAK
jgi:hypothetical protein